jgi:hypothetical protein
MLSKKAKEILNRKTEMGGFPRPYYKTEGDTREVLAVELELINRANFSAFEDPDYVRRYCRAFAQAWANKEVWDEDGFVQMFGAKPKFKGEEFEEQLKELRRVHRISEYKGDISKEHIKYLAELQSKDYSKYQNPEEARAYFTAYAIAEYELYEGRLGKFPVNKPRLKVGVRSDETKDIPQDVFDELSKGTGRISIPGQTRKEIQGRDLHYGSVVGADGQQRGGPRNDDRGGTASQMRGSRGQNWSTRRDC